ncbi:hypothetical protein BB560_002159 [Smittium megazygosporum]|uniref:Aldehyde dehydrogenase domain-containing protein n=1 Tax=Smittium megazygosporum TaxID=133381 RepID=A0A2T9ZFK9_9FUNG|nr:hypothetical protein BB560_002159 [Smittium megazygosporum]
MTISILSHPNSMYINGEWVTGSGSKESNIIDPTTGNTIVSVTDGTAKEANAAVEAARKAFDEGPWYNGYTGMQRRDALLGIARVILENKEKIALLESLNTGKPIANSTFEAMHGAEVFKYFAGLADKQTGKHHSPNHDQSVDAYTVVEALGVVGLITAFNFPFILAIWKIAPALAAGNTVILKPSPQTPLSSLYLAQLCHENNILPPGVLNVVPGGIEAGSSIVNHPWVDAISFTGSVGGGKAVYKASAMSENLKHVTLELGGKSPNVIMGDADIEAAAKHAAAAAFINTGQTCCAGTKIYVHKDIHEKFTDTLVAIAKGMADKLTNDVRTSSIGPLIDQNQLTRVEGFVNRAVQNNEAEVLVGGERWGTTGFYYKPTVLKAKTIQAEVVCEEIFGPVVTILPPFENLDDVIQQESSSQFGLACGIYTNDAKAINKFVKKMRAGSVWVNCFNVLMPYMPFGGFKNSGIGRELGEEAIKEFIVQKSVVSKF